VQKRFFAVDPYLGSPGYQGAQSFGRKVKHQYDQDGQQRPGHRIAPDGNESIDARIPGSIFLKAHGHQPAGPVLVPLGAVPADGDNDDPEPVVAEDQEVGPNA